MGLAFERAGYKATNKIRPAKVRRKRRAIEPKRPTRIRKPL